MSYNWQEKDWPEFWHDLSGAEEALLAFAERMGQASGLLKGLPADAQAEAAIEGELLSRRGVMSSIRKNLDMDGGARMRSRCR
jgi:Fic family protein